MTENGIPYQPAGRGVDFLILDEFKPCFSADELMANSDSNTCKVFILAAQAQGNLNADNFGHESVIKIWEAYFLPQKVDGEKFVDGGLSANNPILLLINEAESFFGPTHPKAYVVSLGTGMMPKITFEDGKVMKLLDYEPWMKLATATEQPTS
ncbi:hypothetical protein DFH08DRAFT_820335 [Mycena albidolilacea]|uniref:PNPLA domain-containing protein n=1 Tax=Mycena albidolilacea TaxID=1033008 RepID=A0AAD7EEB8_9AGAR|nr:hypothetical protein DFH08DRAFT_820335 [Mycena albidolilacea]